MPNPFCTEGQAITLVPWSETLIRSTHQVTSLGKRRSYALVRGFSQVPHVKIHKVHRAISPDQAERSSIGQVGRKGKPLDLLVVTLHRQLAPFHSEDEALIGSRRCARQLHFRPFAVAAAQLHRRHRRRMVIPWFRGTATQHEFSVAEI